MTDTTRPSGGARSELRRTIWPWSTEIPLLSADPFNTDARLVIDNEEYVRCTGRDGYMLTGCERGISPEEGGSEAKLWLGGTLVDQIPWTTTEVVTEYPTTPTLAMVGRDFAWDAGDGNIYRYHVVLIEDSPVVVWDDEPPPIATDMTFSWASLLTGQTNVNGVAIDASGNIYRNANGSYRKYNASLVSQWIATSSGLTGGHAATDGTNVFFTDTGADTTRNRLASTGANGSPATISGGFLDGPIGVVVDATYLYVADSLNNRIIIYNKTTGALVATSSVSLRLPTGIAIDATDLYILSNNLVTGMEVVKIDKTTLLLTSQFILGNGTADGQISTTAEGIAVDSIGRIWIADTGNHRIQVFDSAGVFLGKVGSFGSGASEFKSPKQLAVGAGDVIYVADSGNGRLVTVQEAVETPPAEPALIVITDGTFSGASAVNVNTCFSASYEQYMVVLSNLSTSGTQDLLLRMRVSGTDATTLYHFGRNQVNSSGAASPGGAAASDKWNMLVPSGAAIASGFLMIRFSRPFVVAHTLVSWDGGAEDGNFKSVVGAGLHNSATSYDGFTFFPAAGTVSGTYRIYGIRDTV